MNIKNKPLLKMLTFMAFAYSLGGWAAIDMKESEQTKIKKGQLSLSLMYKYKLENEPELLQEMARRLLADPDLEKRLWSGIELSKHSPKPHITLFAINAVLVLKTMGRSFENRDFSHVHIPGADFSGAKMSGINLVGAHLPNAKFNGAILDHAFLQDANFASATFVNTNLTKTNFMSACLDKTWFSPTSNNTKYAGYYPSANTVAFSPDKDKPLLAWAGDEGMIHLVDPKTGQELRSWREASNKSNDSKSQTDEQQQEAASILSLAFSPDGEQLVSCGTSKQARVYSITNWKTSAWNISHILPHNAAVRFCRFIPKGGTVVCVEGKETVKWWKAASEKLLGSVTHRQRIESIAVSPDGSILALANKNGTISLLNNKTREQKGLLPGNKSGVRHVAFVPTTKSSHLVAVNGDGTVTRWDVAKHNIVTTFDAHHKKGANSVSFAREAVGLFVSAGNDQRVRLWSTRSYSKPLMVLQGHTGSVQQAAISPMGRYVASASMDGTARIYQVKYSNDGVELQQVQVHGKWKPALQMQDANFIGASGLNKQFFKDKYDSKYANEFLFSFFLKLQGAVLEEQLYEDDDENSSMSDTKEKEEKNEQEQEKPLANIKKKRAQSFDQVANTIKSLKNRLNKINSNQHN